MNQIAQADTALNSERDTARLRRCIEAALVNFAILLGAFLISVEFRLSLAIGSTLGADYDAQPLLAFIIVAASALIGGLPAAFFAGLPTKRRLFFGLLAGVIVMFFGFTFLLPALSLLQVFYSVLMALILGVVTILSPPPLAPDTLQRLWQRRGLLVLWTRYNILSRYNQAFLGILWIILLPLSTALVFTFVFSRILLVARLDVPFISFFLTALTFWNLFNQGITTGITAILSRLSLISQVYFPRELLLLITVGENFVDFSFNFATLVVINLASGIPPNIHYVYLPFVLVIQAALTLGLMFFIAYLSVMIRDIPQLIGVLLQVAFYVTPIIYQIDTLPADLKTIVSINPLSTLMTAYRDIILYNRAPNIVSLYYPLVAAFTVLYVGYRFFKSHEQQFADYI